MSTFSSSILARSLMVLTATLGLSMAAVMTNSERMAILDQHNYYRSLTARGSLAGQPGTRYMEKLYWDTALERIATRHAEGCLWGSRSNVREEYMSEKNQSILYSSEWIGQNRRYRTSWGANRDQILEKTSVGAVTSWFESNIHYDHETNQCANGEYCGTYTQIVSDSTRYVGCGYHVCPVLRRPTDSWTRTNAEYVVCLYLTSQSSRKAPYTASAPSRMGDCSGCPSDTGKKCENGLCAGCPSRAYYKCNKDRWSNCYRSKSSCQYCWRYPQSSVCQNCAKTCNFCDVPDNLKNAPAQCSPLNPTGGEIGSTTSKPVVTQSPVTRRPTSGRTMDVNGKCPTNYRYTFTITELWSHLKSATCADYEQALRNYAKCVGVVFECSVRPSDNFPEYNILRIKFETLQTLGDEWKAKGLGASGLKAGIFDELKKMGIMD